jgi:hypothetical protein
MTWPSLHCLHHGLACKGVWRVRAFVLFLVPVFPCSGSLASHMLLADLHLPEPCCLFVVFFWLSAVPWCAEREEGIARQ